MTVHAVGVRLAGPVDADAVARRLRDLTGARLWVEDVPAARLARRRAGELARPVTDVRCVLLRSAGSADLVVVARRDLPVRELAAALLDPAVAVRWESRGVTAVQVADPPEWGLGGGSGAATHLVPVSGDADEAAWREALAGVVAWYGGSDAVGMLFDSGPDIPGAEYVPCQEPVFPLTVTLCRAPAGWQLRCDYLLSHFAPAVVEQFARHLVAAHDSGSVLSDDVVASIVALGRSPVELRTTPMSVPDAFRAVAAADPDAIALCDNEVRLTYRELDERSDAVAGGLRARGVAPGDRVVVCLERTAELVVVLLGVLKAGACYVPADPAYPAERLEYTATDAGAVLVVTSLAEFPSGPVVAPGDLAGERLVEGCSPDSAAYVIYTSGSTGRPKGVVVPHRNVIALMDATRDEYGLGPGEVWTWFHSSAFDFSVWEIWGCLLTGGRLVVVPYADSRDPERFRDLLVAEDVTVLSQTPSAFAQLLEVDHTGVGVRLVVFGGEPLDARILLRWYDHHAGCRVVNMFGITETTVHVTAQTLDRGLALAATRSVGPALPGWHVYVMDEQGLLLPPGAPGEVYVGGAGVALGYLNRPDLTAQRFLPDPHADGLVYRSGDRGRLLPDGTLHHLGRIDSQVKIRGFRIELDEIRAVLLESPDVRAAAVVVRHPGTAQASLDAYVVPADLDPVDLRKRTMSILPEHMVPATVTPLAALPLTTNGKLDPSRLPTPVVTTGATSERAGGDGALGDDGLATALCEAWSAAFGVDVGVDDDFYELGGNSLLAVRISAHLRAHGHPAPKLRDLFRAPTIRALVAIMV
ncbi:non-ribosomal peptide synthetase [Lentzea alba]|uniref:non-ribosomal peptide synthetase n=1 Tax=Lentzea alba TaxID=2714351 RepID=UPI0039BF01D7